MTNTKESILSYLEKRKTPAKTKTISKNLNISIPTSLKYLKKLLRENKVKKSKKGKSFAWEEIKDLSKGEIKRMAKRIPKRINLSKRGVSAIDEVNEYILKNEQKIRMILRNDNRVDLDKAFWLLKETGTRREQERGREMIRKGLWRLYYSK